MLRVYTYVAQSRIHGLGLYAAESIPRGTLVWELEPELDRVLTNAEVDALSDAENPEVRSHVYEQEPGRWILCGDDAVYMNHADDPSCDDPDPSRTVARRDIAVGEELTVDYRLFDLAASRWLEPSRKHSA